MPRAGPRTSGAWMHAAPSLHRLPFRSSSPPPLLLRKHPPPRSHTFNSRIRHREPRTGSKPAADPPPSPSISLPFLPAQVGFAHNGLDITAGVFVRTLDPAAAEHLLCAAGAPLAAVPLPAGACRRGVRLALDGRMGP